VFDHGVDGRFQRSGVSADLAEQQGGTGHDPFSVARPLGVSFSGAVVGIGAAFYWSDRMRCVGAACRGRTLAYTVS
jgi:hypothetical protein